MARTAIIIGNKEFKFQKDALAYFKDMLSRHRKNATIDGEDNLSLLSLIERHPEAVHKIGSGVKRFYKAPADMGTSCFWLERVDGSNTDFSYITAVKAKGKSLYQEFAEACRNSIQPDLTRTKECFFENNADSDGCVECEISGERIAIYESHLDHKKPMTFQVIVRTFIEAHEIEINRDMLSEPKDAQFTTEFTDLSIKERFKKYHHNIAQLRIINTKSNLSLGGSERITRSKRPVAIVIS